MTLPRYDALAEVVGDHTEFAVIAGLGSAVLDTARLTGNADTVFPMDGAMGAAVPTGLGLALARPDLRVLVVTGDGELLMNAGVLATVAAQDPANLAILVLDNGRYGLTGGQATHTALGTDIARMAAAAGIRETLTTTTTDDLPAAAKLLHTDAHARLVVLKVDDGPSAPHPVDRDASACRTRFAAAVAR